jgi:branched-chain amino acid transport system substrate-binding protein
MNYPESVTVLVVAVSWFGINPAVAANAKDQHTETVRVAAMLDLQGAQASLGRPAMNGFVLGLEQGANARTILFSSLIDTKSDPEATESAAENIAPRVLLGAGFTDNGSVLTAGPFFQRAKVPFLSIGATDPALPDVVGNRIFLVPFGDNTQGAAAAEFGEQQFGDSVAIVWDSTSQYSRTLPRYFRERFEELGGNVVMDASYNGGCDITALGRQVENLLQRPSFIYLAGLPDCIGDIVSSLRAAGVTAPIVGGDGLDTPELLEGNLGPTNDVWFTTHAWLSEETGTPEAKAFLAAYRDAYGVPPPDAFAALGYDAARLVLDILHRARNEGGLFEALEHTRNFQGVTGTISFSSDSHVPLKTVWVIAVQNGEKRLASSFVPESVPPPLPESVDNVLNSLFKPGGRSNTKDSSPKQ